MANTKLPSRLLDTSAVPALNVTGDLTVDTTTLVVDTTNNRVGIGIPSPSTEFHVKGGGTVATFEGTGGTSFISIKDSDDSTQAFIGVDAGVLKFQTSGSSYSDKLVIDTSGNVDIAGNVTAPNLINIATHAGRQNTTAREFMSIKNTGTGTGDYCELKLFNDNDDYIVLGTIGSNYNSADWAGSSYLYSDRELRIKSENEIKLYTGGFTHTANHRLTVTSNGTIIQESSMVAGSSGNHALIKPRSGSAANSTTAAIAIQQATSEGDTIIFADYDPYVEYGISALNQSDELIFTAGSSSNPVTGRANRTYYNNAGSARTAYTKFYFNLHTADLGLGGDIVPNAGHGINFGNSSPSPNGGASGSSNILDDYEEGTWTPTLLNGGTISQIHAATYTKVGRLVHYNTYIVFSVPNNGSVFAIAGLPYTPNGGGSNYTSASCGYYGSGNLQVAQNAITHASSNYVYIHRADGTSATVKNSMMYANGWSSNNSLIISGCFVHA